MQRAVHCPPLHLSCWLALRYINTECCVVIANKIGEELCSFFVAGVGRYQMNPFGSFIEALADLIDGCWFALHLCPQRSLNDVTDNRARVTVRCGGLAGPIGDLHDRDAELVTIQPWQIVGETDSRPFVFLSYTTCGSRGN